MYIFGKYISVQQTSKHRVLFLCVRFRAASEGWVPEAVSWCSPAAWRMAIQPLQHQTRRLMQLEQVKLPNKRQDRRPLSLSLSVRPPVVPLDTCKEQRDAKPKDATMHLVPPSFDLQR